MSMTITMQGFTLAAINDAEETKLRSKFEVKICKVNGSQNIGQGHWVKVPASRVCQGQLLCMVSHLQLSMMRRKPNFDLKINKVNWP